MLVSPVFTRPVSSIFALFICLVQPGVRSAKAQFVSSANTPPKTSNKRVDKAPPSPEVSLGFFGQLTPTRAPTTTITYSNPLATYTYIFDNRQTTSSSAGVEATFHQQFSRLLGYNVNLGYSRFAEKYASVHTGGILLPDSHQSFGTNMYEVGATAVVEGPRTRRFSTFAETGVSALTFLPTVRPSDLHLQFRPALAFGIGVNYKLRSYLSARIAYKGLFYENPDFRSPGTIIGDAQLFTVTSEPTVSLTYTFGKRAKSR